MSEWVAVCADESEEPVEIPTEPDGTLLLSSVVAQFPGTTGLKFRHPETNKLRGVRVQGESMIAPTEQGWDQYTYICVRDSPKKDEPRLKRKTDSDIEMYSKNFKVDEDESDEPTDLIILGLPWKTKEEAIKEYCEQYGETTMVTIKTKSSGESKGFGFVRFADKEVERKVILQRHMIEGRWCDFKYPDSQKATGDKTSSKIFVGRVTEAMSKDDLREHFANFGDVTDVYIPNPFRHFAFVQFSESRTAQSLLGKEHTIKGVTVKIGEASPKGRDQQHGGGGGGQRFMNRGFNAFDNPYGGYSGGQVFGGGLSFNNGPMMPMSGGGMNYGAGPSRDHRRF